ncbi:hypothetical protein HU200_052682 [Digitaria exilis]|uniref:Uncharacterized protein n=1 Tax=Digitaria exilis TaxID=1010633 RepID=A0A835AN51_9POAL|nr:hypothetical protein HU200_052682 [Digitaria exilis]
MSEASHDASKLPAALISLGVALSAAALSLAIFQAPGGILLHGCLIAIATLGLIEASFGYWVVPHDLKGWQAFAKTMLWFSILPLVLVIALGGSVFLK